MSIPDIQLDVCGTHVVVGSGELDRVGDAARRVAPLRDAAGIVVVTDHRVAELYAERVDASLHHAGWQTRRFAVEPGEDSKSLATLSSLYQFLAAHEVARDWAILALGGGVVSDLAGFAAATWMRGIAFFTCATTLEAAIDASVGGKTAINVPGGKNLVGAFHHPALVVIDPAVFSTLDPRNIRAGLAESVKHGLIASPELLEWQQSHVGEILALDPQAILHLIVENLRIKGRFVESDVTEQKGQRVMLNFGHTIGHAIEECCGFALRHGECVALGMLAACRLSQEFANMAPSVTHRCGALLAAFGLPTRLSLAIEPDQILAAIRRDKKVRGNAVQFVLLEDIGKPLLHADIPISAIRTAFESLVIRNR